MVESSREMTGVCEREAEVWGYHAKRRRVSKLQTHQMIEVGGLTIGSYTTQVVLS
jgi:hypothetical protein